MKKTFFIAIVIITGFSCKKEIKSKVSEETIVLGNPEKTTRQNEDLTLLKGDFVYFDGAAVLQTGADIYGVLITDKMHELNKKAEAYKSEPTDMVQVEVRGRITNKKDKKILWENKVEIVEILNVAPPKKENSNVVKLGN